MKLYYAPGACSLGIHVLLEEIGAPYDLELVDFKAGAQYKPPFVEINPKSKVPTLVLDDGTVLTEFPAIAYFLARSHAAAKLLPEDLAGEVLALSTTDYVVATIHMQGFARLFRTSNFTPTPEDEEKVKARGREIIEKAFALVDKALAGRDFVTGRFSIADATLFYVEFWAAQRLKMTLPSNLDAHYQRMRARPAVARALAQEGLG